MRVKIFLHGHLKEKIGTDFVCTEARTAYEAIKSITNRYKKVLKAPLDLGKWKVRLKDYDTREKMMRRLRHNVLHLYPKFSTAKSAGVTQIVVGALLIAAAFIMPASVALWGSLALNASTVALAGASLILSGALTMMMAPNLNTDNTDTKDKYLGAGEHTTAAGTRIPFGYGKFKIAGHYISYNTSSTLYVAG